MIFNIIGTRNYRKEGTRVSIGIQGDCAECRIFYCYADCHYAECGGASSKRRRTQGYVRVGQIASLSNAFRAMLRSFSPQALPAIGSQ